LTSITAAGPGITEHLTAAQTRLDEITRRSAAAEILRYLRLAALGDERLLRDHATPAVKAEHIEAGLHRSPPLSGGAAPPDHHADPPRGDTPPPPGRG
jgi:hypothetical protein